MNESTEKYMDFLDEIYGIEGYGMFHLENDPLAFEVGLNDWLRERE